MLCPALPVLSEGPDVSDRVGAMTTVNCSVCRQPIDLGQWHIVGFTDPKTKKMIFLWKINNPDHFEVVLGNNRCVRRYYTKYPEYKPRLQELLTR